MEEATERLAQALDRGERIAVWGDFDADGQTSTALLKDTLQALGAEVRFHIPDRAQGHGLHEPDLQRLILEGARLILTCDTGVTAGVAVRQAHESGAEVIITDHHVPGDVLPPALAVINPHRLPAGHPMRYLTGVGVAYQLARALDPSCAQRALDLVALGTVADVGVLRDDNRYLVQRGLEALRHTKRPGLRALYEAADLRPEGITEEHIGFVLAPRLNALGRIEEADAAHGVDLLTTADPVRARTLAAELEALNARRQWVTKQVTDAALAQIERDPSLLRQHHVLVLNHPSWPPGIVGIVAGRLREQFGKPVVLIAEPRGRAATGSGRSVEHVDLLAALKECAPLLGEFGGHATAAGFSIDPGRIPAFRAALSRAVAGQVQEMPSPTLAIDAYVELADLTLDLVAEIERLAPFGRGNPPLTLAVRDLRILSEATIGRTEEHRRLTVADNQDRTQTVFWWHGAGWPLPQGRFDLALTLRTSDYRGLTEVQVEWLDAREQEPAVVEVAPAPAIRICDYRNVDSPGEVLRQWVVGEEVQIWAERRAPPGWEVRNRQELRPATRLAIWTLPPGPRELEAALVAVQPEEVALFAHHPGPDDAATLLTELAGRIKHALQAHDGQIDLVAVAAAMAQRPSTIQVGLEWFAAKGQVVIAERGDARWKVVAGQGQPDAQRTRQARARLDALLAETDAYRAYAGSAPAAAVIRTSA
jgi:single-stranded-DNA-specific exonuclease